jgi:hypothetical protein
MNSDTAGISFMVFMTRSLCWSEKDVDVVRSVRDVAMNAAGATRGPSSQRASQRATTAAAREDAATWVTCLDPVQPRPTGGRAFRRCALVTRPNCQGRGKSPIGR